MLDSQTPPKVRFDNVLNYIGLKFSTNGIDYSIPDNNSTSSNAKTSFIDSVSPVSSDFEVTLNLRLCVSGEELLPNGKCQDCGAGTYLLDAPTST